MSGGAREARKASPKNGVIHVTRTRHYPDNTLSRLQQYDLSFFRTALTNRLWPAGSALKAASQSCQPHRQRHASLSPSQYHIVQPEAMATAVRLKEAVKDYGDDLRQLPSRLRQRAFKTETYEEMRASADLSSQNNMVRSLRWPTLTLLCIGHVSRTVCFLSDRLTLTCCLIRPQPSSPLASVLRL